MALLKNGPKKKAATPPQAAPAVPEDTLTPDKRAAYSEHHRRMKTFREAHRALD